MNVRFEMEGGIAAFPGLNKPVTIKTDEMSADQAAALQQLVQAARFFDLPAIVGAHSPSAADYRTYTITIEDAGRRHTVSMSDPIEDENVAALVDYLQKQARASK